MRGDGALGQVRDSHNEWYAREVERGRRFHGAWSGGFSAGYHNTVGSAEGWMPSQFSSSRSERAPVRHLTPMEIGDDEDGLLGGQLGVSASYESGGAVDSRSRAMLRLLRRRRKAELAAGRQLEVDLGGEDDLLVEPAKIAIKMDRHCIGYSGSLLTARQESVYRVSDLFSGHQSRIVTVDRGASGFALADDEDDVYESSPPRPPRLAVLDEEDDGSGLSVRHTGRLLEGRSGLVSKGAGLPGFTRSLGERRVRYDRLPSPPRSWRGKHEFAEPPLESPWRKANGRRPKPAILAQPSPKLDQLRTAMSGRFSSAKTEITAPERTAGLSQPKPKVLPQPQPQPQPQPAAEPSSWMRRPTRSVASWQPLPLVCKRFGWPVPRVDSKLDIEALRSRQFATSADRAVTTATTRSKLFDSSIGEHLVDNSHPTAEPELEPAAPTNTLPQRPPPDLFEAIFNTEQPKKSPTDDKMTRQKPKDDLPAATPVPASGPEHSATDLFADLLTNPNIGLQRADVELLRRERPRRSVSAEDDDPPRKKKHKKEKKRKKKHKRDDLHEKRHRREKNGKRERKRTKTHRSRESEDEANGGDDDDVSDGEARD